VRAAETNCWDLAIYFKYLVWKIEGNARAILMMAFAKCSVLVRLCTKHGSRRAWKVGGKVRLCESGNWVHMVCPDSRS